MTIYVSEAHPEDEWRLESNHRAGVLLTQPRVFEERRAAAQILVERFAYDLPLAIDSLEGAAERAYSAWPERLYVVATGGRIVYRGGVGPFGFDPEQMARALAAQLEAIRAS